MALKNSQYDTIMREYEQKQLHSQDVLNAHYQRVYDCIPEIRDLENAISISLSRKHEISWREMRLPSPL